MCHIRPSNGGRFLAACIAVCLAAAGCRCPQPGGMVWAPQKSCLEPMVPVPPPDMPRELAKVSLPEYVIEPPDILLIDAVKVVPRPPYRIESLDVLAVRVNPDTLLPDLPVEGTFVVEPGGFINLNAPYGRVQVAGLDLEQAREAIRRHLSEFVGEPEVFPVSLVQTSGEQQIAGEHIVGPDGKVTLGTYGKVYVTGMTQQQAKEAIEAHLAQFLENPEVAVDIFAYNSKVYYVITEGAGLGDGVVRFPVTGNETVLDAVSNINGLESVSSKRIWIARPAPYGVGCHQVLPVDWHAITQRADTGTNYQLLPGDRLFVAEDRLVATDTFISKLTAPFERVFGFALLGGRTVQFYRFFHRGNQFGGFGGGGGF